MPELSSNMTDCSSDLKELQIMNERKDRFITVLAHELRSPLAPIANAVDVLAMSNHDPKIVPYACGVIRRQMCLLSRLVDDLFDISRIAHGDVGITRVPVDLQSVVWMAIEASAPLIKLRDQHLTTTLREEPVMVNADATRLSQVFTNLLHNAAKYTDKGGQIALSSECSEDTATVRVKDSGIGIAAEALPVIFELFARAGHDAGGLGIGLSLARQLIELHSGSIAAHSEGPGRGSEFVVRLPLLSIRGSTAG